MGKHSLKKQETPNNWAWVAVAAAAVAGVLCLIRLISRAR